MSALQELLDSYIKATPELDLWRRWPYVTEEEADSTDTWECAQVSASFAAHARACGYGAVVVEADMKAPLAGTHVWTEVQADGQTVAVDWTARQYHNLWKADGHDPAVLRVSWPLLWRPESREPGDHPIAGPYERDWSKQ